MFTKSKIKKLKKIKAKKITSKTIALLGDEILKALEEGNELKSIADYISDEIGKPISYGSLRRWASKTKKEGAKMNSAKKNVILVANEKGGVGKTTISSLIELPNSIIVNLDQERTISGIFPYREVIDFSLLKEENESGIETVDEVIDVLLDEESTYENIIIDTKGNLSGEWVNIINKVDYVITPVEVGTLSEGATFDFVEILNDYFDEIGTSPKIAIVVNKITNEWLTRENDKYKFNEKMEDTIDKFKSILGDKLDTITYLKYSNAIKTREIKKIDLKKMIQINPVAYIALKREIKRLNDDLSKMILDD